jgi:hypothetical protein
MTPRINPSIPPATLPFRGLPEDDDVYVMRNPLLRKRLALSLREPSPVMNEANLRCLRPLGDCRASGEAK